MKATWRKLFTVLAAVAAATGLGTWAHAQDLPTPPASVEERLQKLEQQNVLLRQTNENLLKNLDHLNSKVSVQDEARVPADEVQRLVHGYLQEEKKEQKKDAGKGPAVPGFYEVGTDRKLSASWTDGLNLTTANNDFKMHIGGRLNHDWTWWGQPRDLRRASDDKTLKGVGDIEDGIFFRRARFKMDGTLWEVYEYEMEIDFASVSDIVFQDFYIGLTQIPVLGKVRAGNVRPPQGLETYTSSRFLTFMERSAIFDAFYTEYAPGIWILNNTENERMTFATTFHRFPVNDNGFDFGDGDYGWTSRVTLLPWYADNGRRLAHLGASYQIRSGENVAADSKSIERTLRYRSRPELRAGGLTPRLVDSGFIETDHAHQLGLEGVIQLGNFYLQGEATLTSLSDAAKVGGKSLGDPTFHGYYVYASYFLTGENRGWDKKLARAARTVPHENFFLVRDDNGGTSFGRGAWEVAARYSRVDLNDNAFKGGVLDEATLALNWYLNPNMRIQWNWVIADRHDLAPGNAEGTLHGVGMRFHFDF